MTNAPETPQTPQTPAPANLPSRILGVLVSPKATFQRIVAAPRWFGMLAFLVVFLAGATFIFLSTSVGRQALLDQQVSSMEAFGVQVTDEAYAQMERRVGISAYFGAAAQLVTVPIIYLIISGILFVVFNAGFGGDATFKQLYTVVVHSGAVGVVQQLFSLPVNYFRGSMSSPTNLSALLPMLPERSFLTYLLGAVDIFLIWWVTVLAIGLAVLYRRRTQPIAVSLFIVYAVIAVIIAGVRSWMGGS
jgi:hypothetical protein